MALRNIVKFGDPILNKTSRKIEKFDDRLAILIDDMLETMYQANGVGLAAVQVGMLKRVVVIDIGDGPMKVQVKAQDRNGKWQVFTGEGLKARAFCHEIDHLDGILFTSHVVGELETQ